MSDSLYERLGGVEKITQIVETAVANHLANPTVKTRFEHAKDLDRARRLSVEFFCAGSGGPQEYTGDGMLGAHQGMNVSAEEFIAVVDDVLAALDAHGVGETERKDVLAILYSLKGEILRV